MRRKTLLSAVGLTLALGVHGALASEHGDRGHRETRAGQSRAHDEAAEHKDRSAVRRDDDEGRKHKSQDSSRDRDDRDADGDKRRAGRKS